MVACGISYSSISDLTSLVYDHRPFSSLCFSQCWNRNVKASLIQPKAREGINSRNYGDAVDIETMRCFPGDRAFSLSERWLKTLPSKQLDTMLNSNSLPHGVSHYNRIDAPISKPFRCILCDCVINGRGWPVAIECPCQKP